MKDKPSEFTWWVPESGYAWGALISTLVYNRIQESQDLSPSAAKEITGIMPVRCFEVFCKSVPDTKENRPYLDAIIPLISYLSYRQRACLRHDIKSRARTSYGAVAVRWYYPLRREHTGLFRTFAEPRATKEDILAFANQHACLKDMAMYNWWRKQILAMRRAVRLWDLWRHKRFEDLAHHFQWTKRPNGVQVLKYDSHPRKRPEFPDKRVTRIIPDHVADLVKGKEAYVVAPSYLAWLISCRMRRCVRISLHWDQKEKRMRRQDVPANLLGALWLQFEQAVAGNKDFRPCPVCGKWIEISRAAFRSDAQYCDNKCRSKAYRERKECARKLSGEGMSIKKIAKELETNEETVEG